MMKPSENCLQKGELAQLLPQRLRNLRILYGVTQREISGVLNVSRSSYMGTRSRPCRCCAPWRLITM
ncbi:hypothetical protein [Hydrogeniiclostridium mannosilyticum]|uniref:hypothetical protein n=1 Tax=Hydrogeniiclostridium mannosilyticum TaxID=2764322 RepID=UPI00399AB9CF